ncbi:hypothetical protein OIO89_01270 (plasmid) [Mycobacterium ulcerans]|nr:hypothetical protein OIO89_01270 [Mycobacterium ulcerans]
MHVDQPSPHIDWSSSTVQLLTEPINGPTPTTPAPRQLSSFGISGTNAHLILNNPPPPTPQTPNTTTGSDPAVGSDPAAGVLVWPLSARSAPGLSAQAARLPPASQRPPRSGSDRCSPQPGYHAATTPTAPPSPPALSTTAKTTATQPMRWPHCTPWPTTAHTPAEQRPADPTGPRQNSVRVPGQGSQYPGMGADLYRQFPCSPTPSTHATQRYSLSLDGRC